MASRTSRHRWVVFTAAWIITFFIAAVAVFSVVLPPLSEVRGWEAGEVTLAYSLYTLSLAVCGIFSGRVADRYGTVPLMYAGGALFGLGWFLTGSASSPGMLYLTFGVIAGAGCGIVYNPTIATTLKWFPDIRGKASGMLLAAAAIGPAALSPVVNRLVTVAGPTTALHVLGGAFFVAIAGCGWLVTAPPGSRAPSASSGPTDSAGESGQLDWSSMIRTAQFWALLAAFACAATAGTMLVTSLSGIAQFQVGAVGSMSAAAFGAVVVSVSTVANFVGRLGFGALFDRCGGHRALLISLGLTVCAMLGMTVARSVPVLLACVVVLGFAFGGVLVIFPPLTGAAFGTANLGINYGIVFLGYAVGGFIGPRLTSTLFTPEVGYRDAYVGAVLIALLGVGIVLALVVAGRSKRAQRPHQPALASSGR